MSTYYTKRWLANVVGEFIDKQGTTGATARDVLARCVTPGGHRLSYEQTRRALAYLWENGWTPAGKTYPVTRTLVGSGRRSRYVMGTHATKQQIDDARFQRLLEEETRVTRDARQADILLQKDSHDRDARSDRSGSLMIRAAILGQMSQLLARNPRYRGQLAMRRGWLSGKSLLDDVMAS